MPPSRNDDDEDPSEEEEEWQEEASSEEWEEDEEEEASLRSRSLLWLCQEGQIQFARRRFDRLMEEEKTEQLHREVFQVGRDKNYVIHELLMGGTSDRNAYQLTLQLLEFSKNNYPQEHRQMLLVQPPSHKRTALHWAAWGNATMEILQPLVVVGNPEALVKKDKAGRTPAEIFQYYFCSNRNSHGNNSRSNNSNQNSNSNDPRLKFLERMTQSWTQHRLRLAIHLSALRYFGTNGLTPFDKAHRKEQTNMTPKSWFVLSILGTLMQREMKPLLHRILQYTGVTAKIAAVGRKKKRKRSSTKVAAAGNNKKRKCPSS